MPRFSEGSRISHFTIEVSLGGGGMGEVYRAHDIDLHRHVALKCPKPDLIDQSGEFSNRIRQRFLHEARAQARVSHPNVCTIYEVDEKNDFFAMEYIQGCSLAQTLSASVRQRNELANLIVQVADALVAAHEQNIVHRDLKPSNIIVTESGHVKVLDFGLAKLTDSTHPIGVRGGTPGYMAPEQALNPRDVDSRADVYSLGVIIYELVTKQLPFVHPVPSDRADPPRFEGFGFEPWPDLNNVVLKALQHKREDRHPTMAAMLSELRSVQLRLENTGEPYKFFDASTLAHVIGDKPKSRGERRRWALARKRFMIEQAANSAISSPTALRGVLDGLGRHFLSRFEEMAGQLVPRTIAPRTLLQQYFHLSSAMKLKAEDAWVLAEALAMGSTEVYSDEPRYRRYRRILKRVETGWYKFPDSVQGDPDREVPGSQLETETMKHD